MKTLTRDILTAFTAAAISLAFLSAIGGFWGYVLTVWTFLAAAVAAEAMDSERGRE